MFQICVNYCFIPIELHLTLLSLNGFPFCLHTRTLRMFLQGWTLTGAHRFWAGPQSFARKCLFSQCKKCLWQSGPLGQKVGVHPCSCITLFFISGSQNVQTSILMVILHCAGSLPLLGHPTALAYSRARACCSCSRCGMGGLFSCFFSSLSYLSFSNASSVGRRLDITEILWSQPF